MLIDKKAFSSLLLIILSFANLWSQEVESDFKPSGRIIARGFINTHTSLFGNPNTGVQMNISRAYLGYSYDFTEEINSTILVDFASGIDPTTHRLIPTLKHAFLEWHKPLLSIRGGLIGLYQSRYQESYWGHRYIYDSFQYHYKFGNSADLGVLAIYNPLSILSLDFSITNGEGYKRFVANDNFRCELGVAFTPIDGLTLRVYGDIYNRSADSVSHKDQSVLSGLIGYRNELLSAGLEYNHLINFSFEDGRNANGIASYITVNMAKRWSSFVRFDILHSTDKQGNMWNRDGKVFILGVEYRPHKNINISPNFQWNHRDISKDNIYEAYLNLEFRI